MTVGDDELVAFPLEGSTRSGSGVRAAARLATASTATTGPNPGWSSVVTFSSLIVAWNPSRSVPPPT